MKINYIEGKKDNSKKRVAAYCRVSTDHDDQEGSLEHQISHYKKAIEENPDYEYVDVYYDFGISGFKDKREGLIRLLDDCRAGKIDLVITKSISRFARNTKIILDATRELRDKGIGIYFEIQGINTLTAEGELMMTLYAAFAQEESQGISALAKMVYRRKYEAGIPVQYLERSFGYKKVDGIIEIDEEEAPWVRKIYHMIADGHTVASVKRYLNENGITTSAGTAWLDSTVIRLVENEIYKGDYIMHKRFVDDERRLRPNRGEVDSWYIKDDHTPIVSRQLWQKAQEAIKRRRGYIATPSEVKELTDENYPYRHKLYCAYCGHPLYPRTYSAGNRLNWGCSGMKRYGKKFCEGVNVPDSIIRGWDLTGNAYIYNKGNDKGLPEYAYYHESYWRREHKKKTEKADVPALTEANYPYMNHIYCKKCGGKLTRHFNTNSGKVTWICNTYKHHGKASCTGVRVPDSTIRQWQVSEDINIAERRNQDGTISHTYTRKE